MAKTVASEIQSSPLGHRGGYYWPAPRLLQSSFVGVFGCIADAASVRPNRRF